MRRELAIMDGSKPHSPFHYGPPQTALLLMDYQNLTLGMLGEEARSKMLPNVLKLRDWARAHDVLIIHCLIDLSESPVPGRRMVERWPMIKETLAKNPGLADEWAELKVQQPNPSARISISVDKDVKEVTLSRRMGSFSALKSRGIDSLLEQRGIRSLVMAGISTSGCALGTARPAADEGFVVTVIGDACADPVPGVHKTLCTHVLPGSANVMDLEVWEKAWDGKEK